MHEILIKHDVKEPLVQQITRAIARDIDRGILLRDTRLPSINDFSKQYGVARDTIERAYKRLKSQGHIVSVAGNGYFVAGKKDARLQVLLIFNKLSSYKKIVYDSFLATLGKKAKVDLQIHHYDPHILKEIIEANLGKYHYYVVMPHFFHKVNLAECRAIIEMIPANELVILDKKMKGLKGKHIEVYQDFKKDIYRTLTAANDLLKKYKKLFMVLDKQSNHPLEIIEGTKQYCVENKKTFTVIGDCKNEVLKAGTAYIVTTESDLAELLKSIRSSKFILGKDIGVISFNETVLKELLDITVITTDFEAMGKTAANCILNKEIKEVNNPFYMIRRNSL
ncbi:MAG: GntR family transcriptional regulator [Ferruginibacter sp.]